MKAKKAKNSWSHLGTTFFPCDWQDSLVAGFRWYAVVYHGGTGLQYDEQCSPKFATKLEAREWAKMAAESRAVDELAAAARDAELDELVAQHS